ncbi:MAG: ABC transporter ATP-binding protein, partial [Microbacteriaceae bacterium]|nr:ABC transporter ATP-binding protein [Microbacteriaceae bacterium]
MTSSTAGSDVPALEISNLNVWFGTSHRSSKGQESHAVKALNLKVMPGERVGLVGESGCGKTTTILSAMGLLPSTASVSGEVLLNGVDIISGGESGMASHRWREIAMVFQGAMSAFNPVKTIGWQIIEALRIHNVVGEKQSTSRAIELLGLVGLKPNVLDLYPHQLSGGMKQRAMIAMAIAC